MNIRIFPIILPITLLALILACGDTVNNTTTSSEGTAQEEIDTDQDGLSDAREAILGTDPNNADTDNDGATDSDEVRFGSDPGGGDTGARDSDKDFFEDAVEIEALKSNTAATLSHPAIFNGLEAEVYEFNDALGNNPSLDAVLSFIDNNSPRCREAIPLFSSTDNGLDFVVERGGALNTVSGFGDPTCGVLETRFAIRYTANLYLPQGGTVAFEFSVNDGAVIFLDFAEVGRATTGNRFANDSARENVAVDRVTPGIHLLEIVFFQLDAGPNLGFQFHLEINGATVQADQVIVPLGFNGEATK
ncbi:MAG: hypothetical protein D6795_02810 [Deltaproteobacteria bacterium]|nr:MAG: hypothetical protein D6795_02810 [Deltaproteobacteria bacterium]